MTTNHESFYTVANHYLNQLITCYSPSILEEVKKLTDQLYEAWTNRRQVFICGNGGSAANALHMANDFHYGIGACGPGPQLPGLRVEALPANIGILTCLANDTGYENVYSQQLKVKANPGDLLIVLSGSGNSPNVVNALSTARELGMHSYAIVAFSGGRCKELADQAIHFPINDMQIAEDTQLIIGHLCMQWLNTHKPQHLQPRSNG
jgi:D-sedoheptulose 7-phosphate isomerase